MNVTRFWPRYLIIDLLKALDLILYHLLDLMLVIIKRGLIAPRLLLLMALSDHGRYLAECLHQQHFTGLGIFFLS